MPLRLQVVIKVKSNNSTFLGIPATLTGLRRNASETLHLSLANPFDACESITNDISGAAACAFPWWKSQIRNRYCISNQQVLIHCMLYTGMAVLLQRGNCSFSQKANHLQQANAAVGLVANTDEGKAAAPTSLTLAFLQCSQSSRHRGVASVQVACLCPWMILSLTLTIS